MLELYFKYPRVLRRLRDGQMLFDFTVEELAKREPEDVRRIRPLRVALLLLPCPHQQLLVAGFQTGRIHR